MMKDLVLLPRSGRVNVKEAKISLAIRNVFSPSFLFMHNTETQYNLKKNVIVQLFVLL